MVSMKIGGLLAAALLGCACRAEQVVPRGVSPVRVVLADSLMQGDGTKLFHEACDAWGWEAAIDLTNVLSRAWRRSVPLCRESECPANASAIWLGPTVKARTAGFDATKMRRLDARVVVTNGHAFILSPTGTGVRFGVTRFLEEAVGHYWCRLNGGDEIRRVSLSRFPPMDFLVGKGVYAPQSNYWPSRVHYAKNVTGACDGISLFERRTMGYFRQEDVEGRFRVSNAGGLWGCHASYFYAPPEKYFATDPDLYSVMPDGKRHAKRQTGTQLCYSNPKLETVVYTNLVNFIREDRAKHPDDPPMLYDFSQQDCAPLGPFCRCANCRAIIRRYDRTSDEGLNGGNAGLQLWFVNKIARRLQRDWPGVMFRVFAYTIGEVPPPPELIRAEPNVVIWLCDLYGASDHQLPLSHPMNLPRKRLFGDWAKITMNLQLWDYQLASQDFPDLWFDAMAEDAKFFRSIDLPYMFYEDEHNACGFWELNAFIGNHVLMDPTLDREKLLDVYCDRVFGPAAAEAKAFVNRFRREIVARPPADFASWSARALPWQRDIAFLEEIVNLGLQAEAAATTPAARARLAGMLREFEINLAYALKSAKGCEARRRAVTASFLRHSRLYADEMLFGSGNAEAYVKAQQEKADLLDLALTNPPDALKGVSDSDLYVFDWHRIAYYTRARAKADPDKKDAVQKVVDPSAPAGKSLVRFFADSRRRTDLVVGFNDPSRGKAAGHIERRTVVPLPASVRDGAWHWIRADEWRVRRTSNFFPFGKWLAAVSLQDCFRLWDGERHDPNWFEVWMEVRVQGPAFVSGDSRPNALFVDRVVLRRIPEPADAAKRLEPLQQVNGGVPWPPEEGD